MLLAYEREMRFFRLIEGEYIAVEPDAEGVLRSQVFARLLVSLRLVLGRQTGRVAATCAGGHTISPEHQETFVDSLVDCRKVVKFPASFMVLRADCFREGSPEHQVV